MRRRTFALVMVLCLALCQAGFAVETHQDLDPPLWEQQGYESLEAYLTQTGLDEEEYWTQVSQERERLDWIAGFEAENPQWRDNYRKHAPYAQWGGSLQDIMDSQGFATEEEAWDWLYDVYIGSESYSPEDSLIYRVAQGGPAFGVAVKWLGEYVVFPDAKPELAPAGRTMVPARALAELAGFQADYGDGTVTLTRPEGTVIRFRPGETTACMVSDGAEESFEMDVAPYIQEGRTYVPVRFFAQALGYTVSWDNAYKTAVITEPAAEG